MKDTRLNFNEIYQSRKFKRGKANESYATILTLISSIIRPYARVQTLTYLDTP
jgi:hypothetical protein